MTHLKIVFFVFTLGLLCVIACEKSGHETDFSQCSAPTYDDDIKVLIETKCNSIACHGAEEQPVLTYWSAVKASVDNGSFAKEVISDRAMPKGGKLSNEEYDLINCWLNDGAPENNPFQ